MAAIRRGCNPKTGWRKSSRSDTQGCVEVVAHGHVHVRDSRRPGPDIFVPAHAWQELLDTLR